jgi:hypothetical protein
MNNLKEVNIKKAIWHIKRHCDNILNTPEDEICNNNLFYLQSSVDCLKRIINNEKPYPWLDRDEVF